ncbi:MAG: NAD-dependent epimerase/dehydratase family protein, partial [Euryarchaeota archaeon]|nr:NAD-dependent epimerase/dehydratase family protein [Euryarchaeota archaeon]
MKTVVTGGAGFIGSNLADALLAAGHEVHVVDDLSTGHRENVPAGAVFHEESVLDLDRLREVFSGATTVYHQAALGSVPRSVDDPVRSNNVNADGTLNVLVAARDGGVEKVVYAASSSAYGDTLTLPKVEEMTP